jgi:hypothetical protein
MTRTLTKFVACALLLAGSVACSGVPIQIPNTPEQSYDETAGRPISAEASGFQLLLWFPIGINDRHEDCWRELQRRAPNHFITDIRIRDSWTYWFVGTAYTVEMTAMAYPYSRE